MADMNRLETIQRFSGLPITGFVPRTPKAQFEIAQLRAMIAGTESMLKGLLQIVKASPFRKAKQ